MIRRSYTHTPKDTPLLIPWRWVSSLHCKTNLQETQPRKDPEMERWCWLIYPCGSKVTTGILKNKTAFPDCSDVTGENRPDNSAGFEGRERSGGPKNVEASKSWKRQGNRFSPKKLHKGTQPFPRLDFSSGHLCHLWSLELQLCCLFLLFFSLTLNSSHNIFYPTRPC